MFIEQFVVVAAAVIVTGISIGCAKGSIPINSVFGIRIRSVRMTAATWRTGHRAALPAQLIGAGVAIVAGLFANRAALAVLGAETDS